MGNEICTNRLNIFQQIKIKYKKNIIVCKRKNLTYVKSAQTKENVPLLYGQVRLYKEGFVEELVYEGEMRKSKFDGYGKLYKDLKLVYEGEFKDNVFDGWGITPEYTGEFRQGQYDGYGIYKEYLDQSREIVTFYYQGYFQNGLYTGLGVLIKNGLRWPVKQIDKVHENGSIFDYMNNEIEHGINLIKVYGAGQIYMGQFLDGYRHGFGKLFTEKYEFNGQFSHNLYHGFGIMFNKTNEGKRVVQTVYKLGKPFNQSVKK